jgi:ribosomal protein S25
MSLPPRIEAQLTNDAWEAYQKIERTMTVAGYGSLVRDVALPTFDRLARSVMKMSMILAAIRQEPVDNTIMVTDKDVQNAAWYAQKWGKHSIDLILNAGKSVREKIYERVYKKIENNPGINRGRIMQHMHLNKREADDILLTLEERGRIRKETAGKGIRYWVE